MDRTARLALYADAYNLLLTALHDFPRAMWQFRAAPDGWTIHEVVVHITDSEANSYVRARRAIAEPGAPVLGYDEMTWARNLDYHHQDPDEALELFRWLRLRTYRLIQDLPEAVWAHTINHSENGLMTLDDWLDIYARHVPEHIAQMREVHAAWVARQAEG